MLGLTAYCALLLQGLHYHIIINHLMLRTPTRWEKSNDACINAIVLCESCVKVAVMPLIEPFYESTDKATILFGAYALTF